MIYERIQKYCKAEEITLSEFEKMCNIGNGTVSKWRDGKITPTIKILSKISLHTGVTIGYWIGGMK